MWVHRRSEEPAPTEVECYWRKSRLASVARSSTCIKVSDFRDITLSDVDSASSDLFLSRVVSQGITNKSDGEIFKFYCEVPKLFKMSLHYMMLELHKQEYENIKDFSVVSKNIMSNDLCQEAFQATKSQADDPLWRELRYGRIRASKIYNAAHYVASPTFVEQVIGVMKVHETAAMKRGRMLENEVLKEIKKKWCLKKFYQAGLMLHRNFPHIGASPDAYTDDAVVEIKCPSQESTMGNYIKKDGTITARYNAQVQTQMALMNKRKALFCVAHPDFERTKQFKHIFVNYDEVFVNELFSKAQQFWEKKIFPILLHAAKQ